MLEACWVEWNINRSNPNPNDPIWYNLLLGNMFCDENGAPVTSLTVAVTSLMPYFDYQFDNQLMPCSAIGTGNMAKVKQWETAALKKFLSEGGPSGITALQTVSAERPLMLRLNGSATHALQCPAAAVNLLQGTSARQRVLLKARSVESDQAEDSFVRVFVNLPDANVGTSIHDPHFAGSFAFFGGNHMHDGHSVQANFYVDITDTLQRLAKGGGLGAERNVSLQFVLVPMHGGTNPAAHVTIGAVDLSLSRLH
jgi:tyrosinase